jgi:hypothetical protein
MPRLFASDCGSMVSPARLPKHTPPIAHLAPQVDPQVPHGSAFSAVRCAAVAAAAGHFVNTTTTLAAVATAARFPSTTIIALAAVVYAACPTTASSPAAVTTIAVFFSVTPTLAAADTAVVCSASATGLAAAACPKRKIRRSAQPIWLRHTRFGYVTLDFYGTLDLVTSRSIWLDHTR